MKKEKQQYIASISYGKDSLAMLEVIKENNLPLDRIITCDIWATPTIRAEYPEEIEFRKKADKIIKERYGIEVEHIRAEKSFEEQLYTKFTRGKKVGKIYGYPNRVANWCNKALKVIPLDNVTTKSNIVYVGLAADEESRVKRLPHNKIAPLYEYKITEEQAMKICEKLDLLNPIYSLFGRGGNCWFCCNANLNWLRCNYHYYPKYWELMKKWESDSENKRIWNINHTLEDYEKRFIAEEKGLVPMDRTFRWKMLEELDGKNDSII